MTFAMLLTGAGIAVEASEVPAAKRPQGADQGVVLMYHRFGEDRYPSTSVRLEQFDGHLEHLSSAGYSVVSLERIVAAIGGQGTLPDRAIAVTIDDAYQSVYREAFPRLRERGWPFTVFVSTDAVDKGLPGYVTWDQMREMRRGGATFANHSATHDVLIERREGESETAWKARVRADLERAQRRLREELGSAPTLFAYPFGEYDEPLAGLVKTLGYTAFGQQSGAVGRLSDPRALPRFPMAEAFAGLAKFRAKVAALPLPVRSWLPWDPVTSDRRPRLEVTLADGVKRLDELTCYVGGQGRVEPVWSEPRRRFTVRAPRDLPPGRARYNCTAPDETGRRYYWFSQQWVIQPGGGTR